MPSCPESLEAFWGGWDSGCGIKPDAPVNKCIPDARDRLNAIRNLLGL